MLWERVLPEVVFVEAGLTNLTSNPVEIESVFGAA
jgi:hypothetical protein